jgi:hypothetical protein
VRIRQWLDHHLAFTDVFGSALTWAVETMTSMPTQDNGFDCGVYTCMYADYMNARLPLQFTDNDIHQFRKTIALNLLQYKPPSTLSSTAATTDADTVTIDEST